VLEGCGPRRGATGGDVVRQRRPPACLYDALQVLCHQAGVQGRAGLLALPRVPLAQLPPQDARQEGEAALARMLRELRDGCMTPAL